MNAWRMSPPWIGAGTAGYILGPATWKEPGTGLRMSSCRNLQALCGASSTRISAWSPPRTVARLDLETRRVRVVGGAPVTHQLVSSLSGDVWLSSFEEPVVSLIAEGGDIVEGMYDLASGPEQVRLPGSAEGLAIGGGYLWVTSPSDSGGEDKLVGIDLRSRRVVSTLSVGLLPLFATFGYGSAWGRELSRQLRLRRAARLEPGRDDRGVRRAARDRGPAPGPSGWPPSGRRSSSASTPRPGASSAASASATGRSQSRWAPDRSGSRTATNERARGSTLGGLV